MIKNEVIELAKIFLKNSDVPWAVGLLENYIDNPGDMDYLTTFRHFTFALERILQDDYDVSGFSLVDMPLNSIYSFSNRNPPYEPTLPEVKEFDVYVDLNIEKAVIGYISKSADGCVLEWHEAQCIDEAVKKYSWD